MKKCSECGLLKSIEEYHWKVGSRRSNCRNCVAKYTKQHYLENKSYYIKKAKINRKNAQVRLREFLFNYKKDHPCIDCGETDPIVLEFDHLHNKSDGLASMVTRAFSLRIIIEEIAKCEVVCANCHRKRTSKQFNWYNRRFLPGVAE